MTLHIADHWFERQRTDDEITLLWEPYADPLLRCNIWHVAGRERDALIDTGLGISSLKKAAGDLLQKPVVAVATHIHYDHVGGLHEFETRVMHRAEAAGMADYQELATLYASELWSELPQPMAEIGDLPGELLVSAIPKDFDPAAYRVTSTEPNWVVEEGDIIDLGDRDFEVLHLPGHSPGGIGLWEAASGTLFSGDAVYDGTLLDELPGSDIPDYVRTMKRLRELPVTVVHAGHDPSFGRERLHELIDAYLAWRDA